MGTPTLKRSQSGKVSQSVLAALLILGAVIAYFTIGTLLNGQKDVTNTETQERPLFTVLTQRSEAAQSTLTVPLSGRTEASSQVIVRTETAGQVKRTIADGTKVEVGDTLCELEPDNRRALLYETNAAVAKANVDYQAAARLHAEGFTADAGLKTAKAALDAARARQTQAQLNLANATIVAPFEGIVAEVLVDPGDVLGVGGACATLADLSTIVVAGGLAAQDARKVTVGVPAMLTINNQNVPGRVRYVAEVADPRTRAFRVEIDIGSENPQNQGYQAGLAASALIEAGQENATMVPRNALVFNDDGDLGLRTVTIDDGMRVGVVDFHRVDIVEEYANGIAVSGLPEKAVVIVRGQEFVSAGTNVAVEWAISDTEE